MPKQEPILKYQERPGSATYASKPPGQDAYVLTDYGALATEDMKTEGDVRVGGGLYVGGVGTDPDADWIYADGGLYIGDTANANQTIGLTINQAGNDDEALAIKSSDCGHPFTAFAEADTFGTFRKAYGAYGGLQILGYKDSYASGLGKGLELYGLIGDTAADTTKSTAGLGIVSIETAISDGSTGAARPGASENLLSIRSYGLSRFLFDADGDFWYTGTLQSYKNSTTYDVYGFHPLETPATSTSWDGDGKSDSAATVDLSSVFGLPAGIKAVAIRLQADEVGTGDGSLSVGPSSSYPQAVKARSNAGVEDNNSGICPCDSNGDIYVTVNAQETNSLECTIEIYGYWL
jgi:hypothetical protein